MMMMMMMMMMPHCAFVKLTFAYTWEGYPTLEDSRHLRKLAAARTACFHLEVFSSHCLLEIDLSVGSGGFRIKELSDATSVISRISAGRF